MTSSMENQQLLQRAIKLLHSPHPNSATELRLLVDEVMKARLGPDKTLTKMLTKRQIDEEVNFPGRATTPEPQPVPAEDEVINLTHSPTKTISDSPDTIIDSDDAMSNVGTASSSLTLMAGAEEDTNLKEFGDLNCCVCAEMMITATNRLIECSKCGNLYHQECHKPAITPEQASEDQQHNWQCDTCLSKPSTSKAGVSSVTSSTARHSPPPVVVIPDDPVPLISKSKIPSRSSSSSNSSSPFYKQEAPVSSSSSSSKHHHKSSSSTSKSSSKEERPSKGGVKPPLINIISADKSSSSSSRKSHSSSKSSKSSKHHDSKRKSK